jgi:hypothetical protein
VKTLSRPTTDEEWEAEAKRLGVESGAVLKEQVRLADEIIAEVIAEEECERCKPGGPPVRNCGDCGAKPGELHRPGCDVERCCLCGGQAISCDCVYTVNGIDRSRLEFEYEQIYVQGPTQEMADRLEEEERKYGGRLPWTGEFPGTKACREFGLYSYWGDRETGESTDDSPLERPGKWVVCDKDHPKASPDLNRLPQVAKWDRHQRRWVDQRN